MNYEQDPDEHRLDQTLRDKFADFELPPAAPVWAGIEQRLGGPAPAPTSASRSLLPLLLAVVALVRIGGWWAAPTDAPRLVGGRPSEEVNRPSEALIRPSEGANRASETIIRPLEAANRASEGANRPSEGANRASQPLIPPSEGVNRPSEAPIRPAEVRLLVADTGRVGLVVATVAAVAADTLPAVLRPLLALEAAYQTQPKPTLSDPATADRTAVLATLRAERAELLHLQRRTDSLLLALGDVPAATPLAQRPDSAQARPKTPLFGLPLRRWSLLLAGAPEQNYLGFDAPGHDELTNLRRNQETGRGGANAALLAEYQATKRLSVGAGVGYSTYGAELRQALTTTAYDVRYETAVTTSNTNYTSTSQTYSIRVVQLPQLSPIFNASGQVLRYDTVYVPRNDTLRATVVSHDAVKGTTTTVTPLLQPTTTTTYQTYRPDYRFLTLPVLLRYRLTPTANVRWWADVAAGAQFQFFLGGSQLVSRDGQTLHTETVRAGQGPFRPLNVALNASLALNYGLSPRLSVSVGPSLRWQALSAFKPETGVRQTPTATGLQVGVRWKL